MKSPPSPKASDPFKQPIYFTEDSDSDTKQLLAPEPDSATGSLVDDVLLHDHFGHAHLESQYSQPGRLMEQIVGSGKVAALAYIQDSQRLYKQLGKAVGRGKSPSRIAVDECRTRIAPPKDTVIPDITINEKPLPPLPLVTLQSCEAHEALNTAMEEESQVWNL
jgi:hypothetical protein